MIPVMLAPEPADFDQKVRQPGLSAIDELVGRKPRLSRRGPKRRKVANSEDEIPPDAFPHFWRAALGDMLDRYERRCAYLAMHIEAATGDPTIDHFLPRRCSWKGVYEWSNYRLCAGLINSVKGELLTIVDPFDVKNDWFALDLSSFKIDRGAHFPRKHEAKLADTLRLLNQRDCCTLRRTYVVQYELGPGEGGIDLSYLARRAPFIASELRRQGRLLRADGSGR